MRNATFCILMLCTLFLALPASGSDHQVTKTVNGLEIKAQLEKNPPAMGDNTVTVVIRDQAGSAVIGAKVRVDYGMPAMPGMPAMNYKSDATLTGESFVAPINFSMTGAWNVTVKVRHNDKISSVKFNVDVR